MNRLKLFAAVCLAAAAWLLAPAHARAAQALAPTSATAAVDPALQDQPFKGWGTSLAWWACVIGGFPEPARSDYIEKAFDPAKGLGLTVVRYNIGGGENPAYLLPNRQYLTFRAAVPGYLNAAGQWNWDSDANQRWVLKAAIAKGADQLEAFSNSPPWWMTRSGSVTGNHPAAGSRAGADNIKPESYTAFADYLVAVTKHFHDAWGVTFQWLEPLNEPTGGWAYGGTQEGAHVDRPAQNAIAKSTGAALGRSGLATRLTASDESTIKDAVLTFPYYESETLQALGKINTHSYGLGDRKKLGEDSRAAGKDLWLSEYGDADASGLTMSRRIVDDIKGLHPSAWVYWQVVDNSGGWGFLRNPLRDEKTTTYTINKKFYVMAQYSRFIRPGYRFIASSDPGGLAAYDAKSKTLVLVSTNSGNAATSLTVDLAKFPKIASGAAVYRTSPRENLARLADLALAGRGFRTTLPARSVTTFVISGVEPAVDVVASLAAPRAAAAKPSKAAPPDPAALATAAQARARLEAWTERDPQKARRNLYVVYWTPADTEPAPNYRARLTRVMKFVQAYYAGQMESYGLGPRTFNLELEGDGLIKLRVVRGSKPFTSYRTESGDEVRRDCAQVLRADGINPDNETIVIFCNLSRWDPEKRTMRQTSPYYASGTHRNGTAWQVDSPLLDPGLLTTREPLLTDGQYGRISPGRYNSIFIGGVAHELGHALGLPHCAECAAEKTTRGTALMGSGNRTMGEDLRGEGLGSFITMPHALKLASNTQFSGSVKGMMQPARVTWDEMSLKSEDKAIRVGGRVSATPAVYLVIGYADPEGQGDYNSTVGCAVPDAEGRFSLAIPAPRDYRRVGEIRMVAVCVNGAATAYANANGRPSFPFRLVGGQPDLSVAQGRMELDKVLARARGGQLTTAESAALQPKTREVIRRLLAPDSAEGKPEPLAVGNAASSITLSDCRPASAATGWNGVHYDRLAEGGGPLISGGEVFAGGLYAHAPASHVYRLGGGWGKLSGSCGIADGNNGTVAFVVLGDGKELWRSGPVKNGKTQAFSVALKGVKQLELQTQLVGGVSGGAWGLWLEPVLAR